MLNGLVSVGKCLQILYGLIALATHFKKSRSPKKAPSVSAVSNRCNKQPRARSPTRSNQPTPPMRLRRWLLPAKRAGQVWWTTSRQQKRRTDPEKTQSHRIRAGPSLESCTWKKIGASFERRGICFGWQRMDFIALFLPANHLGPAKGETNEHKPSLWPSCPTVYRINVQNWLWSTEQAIHLVPAACQHMISAFSAEFCFQQVVFGKLHALEMLNNFYRKKIYVP